MSVPLLIDQNIGTATNIETMHDKSFLIHLVNTIHDYSPLLEWRMNSEPNCAFEINTFRFCNIEKFNCLALAITNDFYI